jgi:hypothetical protein
MLDLSKPPAHMQHRHTSGRLEKKAHLSDSCLPSYGSPRSSCAPALGCCVILHLALVIDDAPHHPCGHALRHERVNLRYDNVTYVTSACNTYTL